MSQLNERRLSVNWQQYLFRLAQQYSDVAQEIIGDNLVSVVLFGSIVRGEAHANSDIDLLIVCRQLPQGVFLRQAVLEPIRQQLQTELRRLWQEGYYIDFAEHLKNREEASQIRLLYLDMTEEAVILFDQDAFFANVLERLRTHLRRTGAQRRKLGTIRYWDLKPDFRPGEVVTL
ncbi:nucleotidyltransferase domain-containing protein [Candidatus Amarolinea dominans]|uniref:nucleotidyltransferase domain-containing protein n=1 Tax=Candidatus Amarolinea dominans TaxID=3140696 RepID=UPI00313468C0|nr:nucleotidyltransferase domain-containing protein [Anaerolineae bacterium]